MDELEKEEFKKEKQEHPSFSNKQISTIVRDHQRADSEGFKHDVAVCHNGAKGAVYKLAKSLKPTKTVHEILTY